MGAGFCKKEETTKCLICKHGEIHHGMATVTLERDRSALLFKQVPAEVCENCGEAYHDEAITADLLRQAEAAVSTGTEFDVRRYKAA